MRFECVDVASSDWLVGVLARENRWMHQYSHLLDTVNEVIFLAVIGR